MMSARLIGTLGAVVLLAGCGTAPNGSASPAGDPASPGAVSDLLAPANCATTLFRTPDGEVLNLTGHWTTVLVGDPTPTPAPLTDWSGSVIRQDGDCVWGVNEYLEGSGPATRRRVFLWYGRLTADLQINGTFIFLSSQDPTTLNGSELSISVGFGVDGSPFLCDRNNPHCPEAVTDGDVIEVQVPEYGLDLQ